MAVLLVLLGFSQSTTLGYQRQKAARKTKPQTSADASFDPAKLTKLAVITVGNNNGGGIQRLRPAQSDQQRIVEDEFVQVLVQKGYSLVSRSDIASVVKEQQFQRSGLTEDNAAALGKLLNVPAVFVLRITESATENQRDPRTGAAVIVGRASLGARLVSVETGAIWWTGKHSESGAVRGRGENSLVLADVARNIALAFPAKSPDKDGSPASSFDPKSLAKLAVITVGNTRPLGSDLQNDQQRLVEDEFVQVLLGKGYSLVSRSDIASAVKEQQFQRSGLTEDNATQLGKLLNVPAVLVVRITECTAENQRAARVPNQVLVGRVSLGARLISVETGLISWSLSQGDSHTLAGRGELSTLLSRVANKLASSFPDKNGTPEKSSTKKGQSSRS